MPGWFLFFWWPRGNAIASPRLFRGITNSACYVGREPTKTLGVCTQRWTISGHQGNCYSHIIFDAQSPRGLSWPPRLVVELTCWTKMPRLRLLIWSGPRPFLSDPYCGVRLEPGDVGWRRDGCGRIGMPGTLHPRRGRPESPRPTISPNSAVAERERGTVPWVDSNLRSRPPPRPLLVRSAAGNFPRWTLRGLLLRQNLVAEGDHGFLFLVVPKMLCTMSGSDTSALTSWNRTRHFLTHDGQTYSVSCAESRSLGQWWHCAVSFLPIRHRYTPK